MGLQGWVGQCLDFIRGVVDNSGKHLWDFFQLGKIVLAGFVGITVLSLNTNIIGWDFFCSHQTQRLNDTCV